MKSFTVLVTQKVRVFMDETKFDDAFTKEFCETIAHIDTLEGHAEHLAWTHATGVENLDTVLNPFLEGYGPIKDMGIKARTISVDTEIVNDFDFVDKL